MADSKSNKKMMAVTRGLSSKCHIIPAQARPKNDIPAIQTPLFRINQPGGLRRYVKDFCVRSTAAPRGQTPHHNLDRKRKEKGSSSHHSIQVTTTAKLSSP